MSFGYAATASAGVVIRSDGMSIPVSSSIAVSVEYRDWLALGNTPVPYESPVTVPQAETAIINRYTFDPAHPYLPLGETVIWENTTTGIRYQVSTDDSGVITSTVISGA